MGVRRVYDLEIAEDHCYLANDIYVHNSNPNLQNLPSNSKYGKLIKSCVQAGEGWLFVGLDFASLEDRISALTTKDKNKLKVYLENYDGHCLRAYAYFGEEMPDICLATEKDRCFEVVVNGQKQVIKCGTLVTCPDGVIRKIEDFYDMETSS